MPAGAGGLQAGDDVADDRLVEDRVHVDPVLVGQAGDRRLLQGRQQRQHLRAAGRAARSSSGPTLPSAAIAPWSISTMSSIFCFFQGSA